MWVIPNRVSLVSGAGEGRTRLTAFDAALLSAGIAHLNLVRVSSILPPGAEFAPLPEIPPGAVVPTVYRAFWSDVPGEVISVCVAAGLSPDGHGLLMEYAHAGPAKVAEEIVAEMVEESMAARGFRCDGVRFASAEHRVDRMGCVVAAAVLWRG